MPQPGTVVAWIVAATVSICVLAILVAVTVRLVEWIVP